MVKKTVKIVGVILLILVVLLAGKTCLDYAFRAQDQKKMAKNDDELLGAHFYVPREG